MASFARKVRVCRFCGAKSLLLLFCLGQNTLAFQSGKVIDKQLAIEMIYLMLNTDRENAIGLLFKGLSRLIKGRDPYPFGAFDVFADIGNGETTFFHLGSSSPFDNFWIDKTNWLRPFLGYIDHDDLLLNIDLNGRKTNTLGRIHGMEHIIDKPFNRLVDGTDRPCPVTQSWIRIVENGKS
ncbi:MAG: hypothetical protein BECKG1743D_GA0114223_101003 [Candidatus Kentron sp. G]|nr:MAG: hypothetical protein BECKG1743E_GA0114224_100855 [Candidatus Kentron sp. G]VFM97853.1 MAG: hypothetical protein BECKG1743F_GA0114225_102741 [Candidatus Kentron sp. G]VFM99062.1 MAG: hypothetical protein BECKG1743D_GA0114223_101003 [Candidatus Kentron sp. G]